jgi:signal transduction histidine kinase
VSNIEHTRQLPQAPPNHPPLQIGLTGYAVTYLVFAAVLARTLVVEGLRPVLSTYLAGELVFLASFSAVLIASRLVRLPAWLLHAAFAFQSALILWLISLYPKFDFVILLYVMLSILASLVFRGPLLWSWVSIFVLLSGGSLIYYLGAARGLALSLTTIAAEFVIPAYMTVHHENVLAQQHSQALIDELQQVNQRLQSYTSQVSDLAALQERNRLARTLHDTTSQVMFSILLTARSAQMLLETDPQRLREQLKQLETLTGAALAQLRSLITQLHPPQPSKNQN